MRGQFNSPVDLPGDVRDPVPVAGPLLEVDPEADQATIVCVLVQGEMDDTSRDPADPPAPPVWVEGRGTWNQDETAWTGTVSRDGRVIGGGRRALVPGPARGIAVAVAVIEQPEDNGRMVPPRIDTVTWCVNIELQ